MTINSGHHGSSAGIPMRIVTRPDFDGIVCAVLLRRALNINTPIYWVEPNEIQTGNALVQHGDIIANLPYAPECSLWFDHHISNTPLKKINGSFEIAPSAAGVIYKYYQANETLGPVYDDLVRHTDIIDAARLNQNQVEYPEKYPYLLLSMTIRNRGYEDIPYWNKLVDLLMGTDIHNVLEHPEVRKRCDRVVKENSDFKNHLMAHTRIRDNISVTDFRSLDPVPDGNRFLIYSLFPECIASVKISFDGPEKGHVQLSMGRNIFKSECHVNIGNLLARFGGGGHAGAGGCTLNAQTADRDIEQILEILIQNNKSA